MTLHTDISTLSIWAFNQISETHDYKLLVADKSKKVGIDALASVWSGILMQYMDATSHREMAQNVIDTQKAILEMTITHNNIKTIYFCCSVLFAEPYVSALNEYGYDVQSKKDLKVVERSVKTMMTEIREKEFYLSNLFVKKGEPITFEKVLDRISKHQGYRLNPREITVKEWIAIEDNYIEDIKKGRRE